MKISRTKCLLIFLFIISHRVYSQQPLLTDYQFDESNLAYLHFGATLIDDASASGGKAIYQTTNGASTFWFGPYSQIKGGQYLVSFRLKVSSNASNLSFCYLDLVGLSGGQNFKSLPIKPSMFKNSNEWQLISFPVNIPNGVNDLEVRCIGFQTGISDLYLDYITIKPFDLQGYYSSSIAIEANGKVGIGTSNPDEKLTVKGKIHAQEVKVDLSDPGPDYVFNEDYKLTPLSEIKSYIKTNKHLPEVPSAREMETNGINLSAMNMLLLKKVEELTLHLIEMKEELNGLKKENQNIRKSLNK